MDPAVLLELAMGIYCIVCIYFSVLVEKPFLIPFMAIYAAGFLYISFNAILEHFDMPIRLPVNYEKRLQALTHQTQET